MKTRMIAIVAALCLLIGVLPSGCAAAPQAINTEAFRLSGVTDVTDASGKAAYTMTAPYTDTYTFSSIDTKAIALFDGGRQIASGDGTLTADLTEGGVYTLQVQTDEGGDLFEVQAEAANHLITLPYDIGTPVDTSAFSTESDGADPLTPATIDYIKRAGGTYIYLNNPEQINPAQVNQAYLRTPDLTGEVYVTLEHANYSSAPLYLGYQLKNDGDSDVYVTVTNVGYQAGGTWFGQLAWCDFYNLAFDLPKDYLKGGAITQKYATFDYAYQDYQPRVFQPMTYRLPAGEYFYVIGGTTEDAYLGLNVDNSANKPLGNIKCANGNVKFTVTGGSVTGTLYAYNDVEAVKENPEAIGYRTGGYAAQYLGTAPHHGVIDNDVVWTFSDETANGRLPVSYTNRYDDNLKAVSAPYAAYNSTDHKVESATSWMTHLNPQNNNKAVGMDMVDFACTDEKGNEVVIDNDHADGAGDPANTANWMIEYQDHFTLVNQGDKDRQVKLTLADHGSLAMLVRDENGEVLKTRLTTGLAEKTYSYAYTVTVPAHTIKQLTLDYVLVACSYGSVTHWATLGDAE